MNNRKSKMGQQNPLSPLAPALNNVVSALTGSGQKKSFGRTKKQFKKSGKARLTRPDTQRSMNAPAASTTVISSSSKRTNQPFTIDREEYVSDVIGSSTLTISSFPVNPGIQTSFPWLANIANAYDLYRYIRLRFCYRNRDTSGDKGTVALAFDPNPDDPSPTTLQQVDNFDTRVVTTPWCDACVNTASVDLNRLKKFLVRNALVAVPLSTYDVGTLYLAVSGTGTGKIGELWIEYEIQFYSPQPYDSLTALPIPDSNSIYRQSAQLTVPSTGTTLPIPWDTIIANPIGLVPTAGGVFTGLRGSLIVYAQMTVAPSAQITGGGLVVELSTDGGTTFVRNIIATWPQGLSPTTPITANVETVLQLLPAYQFRIGLTAFGNTVAGAPASAGGVITNILVLTPA